MSETLVSLWTDVRKRLEAAGVDTPVLDARLLLEAGAGVSRLEIVTDPRRPLSAADVQAVDALTKRREAREPVAHIVGRKHFWTLEFAVNQHVLVPRPETEFVVEAALQAIAYDAPARVLDLGTGSGAILLTILKERPNATGVGVDISPDALAVARANAEELGISNRVDLRDGDWDEGIEGVFDFIASNPPYIASNEIAGLAPEVARYEPRLALDGGADGLNAYRAITKALPRLLKPGGAFALEVGHDQAEAVALLVQDQGLRTSEPRRDLAGIPRVVIGMRQNADA
jgi:release factor glutamine methyltransferase